MGAVWAVLAVLVGTADTGLVVRTVRFYRADPGQSPGQTQVTAFIRVPADLPQPGPDGQVSLAVSFRVRDVAGGTLYQQAWQRRTAVPFPRGDADRLDLIRFTLGAGKYRLEASVTDSVSGRKLEASVPVDGYEAPPAASDLMISPWLRPVASGDTIPQPGEFRRGGLILAIAPEVVVGGSSASLAYLVETYSGSPSAGRLTLTVSDATGIERKRSGPTPIRVAAGIGLVTGQLELGELPPGRYRLITQFDLAGQRIRRDAEFEVDPEAASAPAALPDEAYFEGLAGPALDRAKAPLAAIVPADALRGWPTRGTDAEKRAFLVRFWKSRDATPSTRGNERRAQFYEGVTYADAFYADPSRRLSGWQTDRGRIFLREGLPVQVLRRQQRGRVPGYEVWRYFEPENRYYIFVDRGVLGGFALVRSNDPQEPQLARWQQILTPAGVEEIVNFLGRTVLRPEG